MPVRIGVDQDRRRLLEGEIERMVRLFPDLGVRKAILFGSLARGDVTASSDIDLILVMDTTKRFVDRLDDIIRALRPRVGLDVLVYTPEEFEELRRSRAFVQSAVKEGKVIYEAQSR